MHWRSGGGRGRFWDGFHNGLYVGRVVFYDTMGLERLPGWQALVRHVPIDEVRYETDVDAMAAVEAALDGGV